MGSIRRTFSVVVVDEDGSTSVLDIRFKAHAGHGDGLAIYSVFLGSQKLGTASQIERWGWTATSYKGYDRMTEAQFRLTNATLARLGKPLLDPEPFREPDRLRKVEGFGTRRAAAEYLVQHWGFWDKTGGDDE